MIQKPIPAQKVEPQIKKIIIGFINLIIFFSINNSTPAQNNLQYYLNLSFQNNPSLKENLNLVRISELDKSLVESQYSSPQISLTSNYLFAPYFNNGGKLTSIDPEPNAIGYDVGITNGGLYSALINVEKNIFNGGTIETYKRQSDLRIKNSRYNSELIKHTLIKDVAEQYLNTYQSQQLFILSKGIADTIKKQLMITEELVNKGLIKQSDYLLLKIEVENQKMIAEQYLSDIRKNIFVLNSLCGLKDTNFVNLSSIELNYERIKHESNFNKQFEIDSLLISNQQEIFETKYKPQVNLFFNTGLNALELEGIDRKFGLSAGINFSLPIYDGEQKSLTQQQSQISLKTVEAFKGNQDVLLINKKNETKSQIYFNITYLKSIHSQVSSYEQLLKISQSQLAHGQLSMIDYIMIFKNYLELKKNEITAECSYQSAINQYNYWNW